MSEELEIIPITPEPPLWGNEPLPDLYELVRIPAPLLGPPDPEIVVRTDGARFRAATDAEVAAVAAGVKGLDLWQHQGHFWKRLRGNEPE